MAKMSLHFHTHFKNKSKDLFIQKYFPIQDFHAFVIPDTYYSKLIYMFLFKQLSIKQFPSFQLKEKLLTLNKENEII